MTSSVELKRTFRGACTVSSSQHFPNFGVLVHGCIEPDFCKYAYVQSPHSGSWMHEIEPNSRNPRPVSPVGSCYTLVAAEVPLTDSAAFHKCGKAYGLRSMRFALGDWPLRGGAQCRPKTRRSRPRKICCNIPKCKPRRSKKFFGRQTLKVGRSSYI